MSAPTSIDHVLHLECVLDGRVHAVDAVDYVAPGFGDEGVVDVVYDYDRVAARIDRAALRDSREYSMWRYKALLPVAADAVVPPLRVGWTPLYRAPRLAAAIGLKHLWIKDEGQQPTGSLKDRASAIAVVKARERDAAVITTASTGNAAAALGGLCASVGQSNVIFVPASAPRAKVAQLLAFGSTVLLVEGSYDDAFELCLQASRRYGWYNRNTGYNPYMSEGKKTASLEICEQLGWQAPDVIVTSVGDGCIIGGLYKGLRDLRALGWIDRLPRLLGVQAAGSDFLYQAWKSGEDVLHKAAIAAHTVADSICAGLPRDRVKAMAAVRGTEGAFVRVEDDEILAAIPALARASGVFAEPAAAASWAGLVRAVADGRVGGDERVVVLCTGSGLKDVSGAIRGAEITGRRGHPVAPTIQAVDAVVDCVRISSG